ncbi:MAG TPA: RNA polymerase sigma factor, partial [Longimicrobiales bacterium]|nr:RNA polymerase sigma factor [Longimicrobiales bacterium]
MAEQHSSGGATNLEEQVARARAGDREALELLVRAVQGEVYALALRFLWHPQDAEDAAQDILIRVITNLGTFRGESRFRTWVYRIACNRLLTLRKRSRAQRSMSFQEFGEDLAHGLSDDPLRTDPDIDEHLLLEEVKIGCTLAMLMCLDRNQRIAYILGEILGLDHREAAEVLGIAPATFRKRLSRARTSIVSFMTAQCGLVNPDNACRCRRRVATAIRLGRVDPTNLLFASSYEQARRFPQVLSKIRQLEETRRAAALFHSHSDPRPSEAFVAWLRNVVDENLDVS